MKRFFVSYSRWILSTPWRQLEDKIIKTKSALFVRQTCSVTLKCVKYRVKFQCWGNQDALPHLLGSWARSPPSCSQFYLSLDLNADLLRHRLETAMGSLIMHAGDMLVTSVLTIQKRSVSRVRAAFLRQGLTAAGSSGLRLGTLHLCLEIRHLSWEIQGFFSVQFYTKVQF